MRISLDQQRALYDECAAEAAEQLLDLLAEHRDALIQLGRERAFETVGVHEYGDSTYWKDDETLLAETLAELADGIFYRQIAVARQRGRI